ncbi:serine/threonine-protein kinase [Streptomyces sp. TRM68367]|uniref:serine/threonine-protein kinase n=1 Tax=Streptomyces sp. TRM68367 TaxID=2758415 RepID=UPI00165C2FD7|nr:serine/threonine-protein kinase [Streptomyces sp. TRM68367]MBC9725740.1 serine/threonine protein kinase [Streptomyces sp. TRM68367]
MQGLLLAGRYRLGDAIGSGGMGRVWRAHDEVLNRAVAIKELTAALYVSESDQAVLLARTRAEARAAARINHSAVVTVHDVLEHDGRPWIVMELVAGCSLADAVKERERVEPREAARIGLWVLRALRAAHTAGVLHRDVKPGNVLIADDGRVLLTDFGIAQIEGDTTITRTGEVVGSVEYLAPERVRGHDPGAASDLWALGATLYTAVEGRSPFRRTSPLGIMQAVVEEEATEPHYAGSLAPVISALLRKDPATRPTAAETEHMLAEAAEGRRPQAAQAYVPTQYGGGSGAGGAYQAHQHHANQRHDNHHQAGHSGTTYTGGTAYSGPGHHTGISGHHTGPATASSTPYPPVTGPTTVGPADVGGLPYGIGATPERPRRRRLRTLALVVVLAALVGGGTAVVLQEWAEGRRTDNGVTAPPSSPPSTSQGPEGGVPASWVRRDDPAGFSLYLPKGWKRELFQNRSGMKQVDYTPDGGRHFVRIAVDLTPDFADPHAHQLDLEQQIQRLVDYQRVTLRKNLYRDRNGSLWEYTWTARATDTPFPGPRRAVEETYVARDGTEYAIYMSGPVKDWPRIRKQFTSVLQGWQEKRP